MKNSTFPKLLNQKGFTLIEVMVSMGIFTVGILGLITTVNSITHYQQHSNNLTKATLLCSDKLEEIKRMGTNEPTGGSFGFNYLVSQYFTDEGLAEQGGNRKYGTSETVSGMTRTWSLEVFQPDGSTDQNFDEPTEIRMVEVVVNTQWTDEKGANKNVELAGVLHRRQFVN